MQSSGIIQVQTVQDILRLKDGDRPELCLMTQPVPRSKHTESRL